MQSHSKAGRSLLLLLLALGVASGCGGTTLPEASDSSAPELEDLTQAERNQPRENGLFDGVWVGRPRTLGSCNLQQTKAAFDAIDKRWAAENDAAKKYMTCNTYNREVQPQDHFDMLGHLLKGLAPPGCLSGQGTSSSEAGCTEWNSYAIDDQMDLRTQMARRAQAGQSLTPSQIFKMAMEITGKSPARALWIAYRVTNIMAGEDQRFAQTLNAMPNMRSSCSGLTDRKSRAGIYYHYFLVALITHTYGPGPGALSTVERLASFESAKGDSDKAGANWEGWKLGGDLVRARATGAFTPAGYAFCFRANADNTSVVIGGSTTLPVKANDTATPRSVLGSLGISVSGVPAGLSVSVGSAGFSASKPGLTGSPDSKSGLTGAQNVTSSTLNISALSGPPKKHEFEYALRIPGEGNDDNKDSTTARVVVDVKCPPDKPDWDPAVSQCTDQCGDCESDKYCDTGSGTPTCKCSPESPDWNPTTQKCEPPLTCGGGTSASGGDEGYSKTLELGATSGTISVSYSTYTQKDRIRITYGGATLLDSGCVGESKTIDVPYSGNSTQATVVVEPNCEGGSGTAWDFSFGCAR